MLHDRAKIRILSSRADGKKVKFNLTDIERKIIFSFLSGNELSLISCPFSGWGNENCDHAEDAGVVCQGPSGTQDCVSGCNLTGGFFLDTNNGCGKCSIDCKTCSGNSENCTSCPPETFLNKTGNMTYNCVSFCLERYFPDPLTRSCMPCSQKCYNCEVSRDNCTSCDANEFLRQSKCVQKCQENEMTLQGVDDIRLVGANSTVEGRVEVFHDGEWGTVCDDSFDLNDAHVICRQLKLGKGVEARSRAKYGQGAGKILIDDLQCTGTERNVKDCQMRAGKYACALVGVHDQKNPTHFITSFFSGVWMFV